MGMVKTERREQGQMTREAAEGKQRKAERNVCLSSMSFTKRNCILSGDRA